MDKIIEVAGLQKSYGKVHAVKGVDFYVEKGGLFAFLGPNGAGKSTVIDIICTFLKPDDGQVVIDGLTLGKDDQRIRNIIGAVFQDGMLDELLTVEENLKIRGGLYGFPKKDLEATIEEVSKLVDIKDFIKRPYGKLSGGQKRRADIARALLNKPKILFLDEPTTGLDPQTRKKVWETIRRLQDETKMTIFLTTHYMEEADDAEYVVIIDEGKVKAKGTPYELKEEFSGDVLTLTYKDKEKLEIWLKDKDLSYTGENGNVKVRLNSTMDAIDILAEIRDYIKDFQVVNGTMDDAFINITGKEIRG